MSISIFLEVNYDYARQHSLKKLDVSRTSENPGNHSIGPVFFCRGQSTDDEICGKELSSRHGNYALEGQHDLAQW